jgi:hypothetical protein
MKYDTTEEEYGKYICEVSRVCGKSFTDAVVEGGKYRHIPYPQLFALKYGYQINDVALAWDISMEKGYGHCIPYRKLRTLWEEIVDTCEVERSSWTFTRDLIWKPNISNNEDMITNVEDEEEDMDSDSNDNDSTKCELKKFKFLREGKSKMNLNGLSYPFCRIIRKGHLGHLRRTNLIQSIFFLYILFMT